MAAKEMKQSNYVPGEISQRFLSNSSKTGRLNDIFGNLKPGKSEEPQKLKVNHEETEISQPKKQKRKIFEIEETGIFSNNEENITDTNEELPKKKKSKKEKQKKSSNQEEKKSKQKRKKEIKTKVEEVNEDLEDEIKIEDKLDEEEEDKINEFPNENEKIDRDLQNEEKLKKTIFIGNLPVQLGIKALKKTLKTMFSKYGTVESIRFRSGGYNDPRLQKKVNFYKNNFHPLRDSINSYLVFQEEESVTKALVENNSVIGTKHIRVDKANNNNFDPKKTLFVGNLPYDITEEELRNHFADIGELEGVRVVRDSKFSIGKGFGFVAFQTKEDRNLGLEKNGSVLKERKIRVIKASQKAKRS